MEFERYGRTDFDNYEDFSAHYEMVPPDNFNFAFDCVDRLAHRSPDKTAMVWCDDEGGHAVYTFGQMSARSDAAARFFASVGICRGDRVMLILKRRVEFWFAVLGLMKLGAVAIPATHLMRAEDVTYRNNAASITALVTTDDTVVMDAADGAMAQSPSVRTRISLSGNREGWLAFRAGIAAHAEGAPPVRVTENADMMMLYFTSGTTGLPKMVAHNYAYPLGHIITSRYWQALHPGSLHLTVADTGWAKAVWGKLFGQWLCEAAIFVYDHDRFNVHRLLSVMSRYKVTSFCAPPTLLRVVANADLSAYDLGALEHVTSAGEPLDEELFLQFKGKTGLKIYEAYGQTETMPLVITAFFTEPKVGWLGKPNPAYDVVLLDTDGQEVGRGGEGEICVRTEAGAPGIFMGYYRDSDMTAAAFHENVYHTGDMAQQDEEGYVRFIGRRDDIIKSAGYRIGPFEVESILLTHPAVAGCAVTGAPHPLRGQVIKASIILRDGYAPSEAMKKELRAFVKSNAAAYKTPRLIEFVDSFPLTVSGKIRRVAIREESR
ncbi:MAG: AMP-binding protein [Clostridiales Family XIII bacterium]|jgi:acetyl-CoA synthetase|nr:AMP-binding protein [Clostridiales Family XIII bacterium]